VRDLDISRHLHAVKEILLHCTMNFTEASHGVGQEPDCRSEIH
jgi:hypothetical protein